MSSRQQRQKPQLKEVPYLVSDSASNCVYTKGRFLGKGGFARCYELIDNTTKSVYAAKIVSKLLLGQKHQKDKMTQEVEIHRSLSHPHIVQMFHCFEDADNVYVLLELCARRSLMELHRRRGAVTEPEARYFTHQIVLACSYLHGRRIIHRDLKLGNLFLNDDMQVKIGDFGLATRLESVNELKKTLCGTPNYISPEMFNRTGYSFEVDIWAIGCILYTLLVGKPPFETERLKDTYARIRSNQYTIPPHIGRDATALIRRLLAAEPSCRPKIHEILGTAFFTEGFLPPRLPTSCLTLAPKFNVEAVSGGGHGDDLLRTAKRAPPTPSVPLTTGATTATLEMPQKQDVAAVLATEKPPGEHNDYLPQLYAQLSRVLEACVKPFVEENIVEIQDPASSPIYWVAKWVDYSDKYGLGYQLCDNSIGMIFNDGTKIILDAAGEQMQYTERNNAEHYHTLNHHPPALQKKATLLRLFRTYMNERLLQTGHNIFQNTQGRAGDELARLPFLCHWFRNTAAILFHLSNGTLQINFFHDHSKVILCPLMGAATFISADKSVATFKFSLLERFGCPNELLTRLKYAKKMIERLLAQNGTSLSSATASVANGNRTPSWAEAKLVV